MRTISVINLLIAGLFLFPTSCAHVPLFDETKGVFDYVRSEADTSRFDIDKLDYIDMPRLTNYLDRLSKSVCALNKMDTIPVYAVDTTETQGSAFDGSIYVSKGMLFAIKSEAEMIAVIAHEVGHFALKHDTEYKESIASKTAKETVEEVTGIEIPSSVNDLIEKIKISQFSKNRERAADEFGVLQVSRLGYDPYAFADLLDRLSGMADKNVTARLASLTGSHESLHQRAEHLRSYLKEKSIKPAGRQGVDSYLSVVNQVFAGPKRTLSENLKADKQLKALETFFDQRIQKGQRLSAEEFLRSMNELRVIAKNLNILNQLPHELDRLIDDSSPEFMMELVRVMRPWWWGSDQQLQEATSILFKLGRIGVGSIPYISNAVNFYEFLSGNDFLTGEKLTFGERVASGLGALAGAGKYWKESANGMGAFRFPSAIATSEAQAAGRAVEEAAEGSPIFKGALSKNKSDELKALEGKYRPIKNQENYEKLKDLHDKLEGKNIPDDWPVKVSRKRSKDGKFQGFDFSHPEDPNIRVRVMPGDPNSPHPNSQNPYVRQTVGGKPIDRFGNKVLVESDDTHIPLKEYQFKNFWEKYVKTK